MTSHKIACQYCNKPLTVHYPDSTRIKCNITNRQNGPDYMKIFIGYQSLLCTG